MGRKQKNSKDLIAAKYRGLAEDYPPPAPKAETLKEFLARGGKITKCKAGDK